MRSVYIGKIILFYLSTVGLFSYNQLIFLDFEKLSNHKRQLYILQSYQVWFQIGFATINNFYQRISDFVVVMQQGYKMKYNPIITPIANDKEVKFFNTI